MLARSCFDHHPHGWAAGKASGDGRPSNRHGRDETAAVNVNRVYSQALSEGMLGSPFRTINGFVYPNAERLGVGQGERVQIGYWSHSMMPHPMHLHGHFFKVVNPGLPRSYWIQKETCLKTHDTGRRNRRTC